MGVNINPTESQQKINKIPILILFPFIAGVVDTGD
jgi:hypothetical protein